MCVLQFSFLLASSHHHPFMNFYYTFLLLLVVLSAYSQSPQHAKPPDSPDPTVVTVSPNSSSVQLDILAPVLPQNEVFGSVLPKTEVNTTVLSQNGVFQITVNCQLSKRVKTIIISVLNLGV